MVVNEKQCKQKTAELEEESVHTKPTQKIKQTVVITIYRYVYVIHHKTS